MKKQFQDDIGLWSIQIDTILQLPGYAFFFPPIKNHQKHFHLIDGQETTVKKTSESEAANTKLTGPNMFWTWVFIWCDGDVKLFNEQRAKLFNLGSQTDRR